SLDICAVSLHDALPISRTSSPEASPADSANLAVCTEPPPMIGSAAALKVAKKMMTKVTMPMIATATLLRSANAVGNLLIAGTSRSEEHTSELQSRFDLV